MVNSTADIFLAPMKKPALGGLGFVHQSGKGGAVSSSALGKGGRQLSAEPGRKGSLERKAPRVRGWFRRLFCRFQTVWALGIAEPSTR